MNTQDNNNKQHILDGENPAFIFNMTSTKLLVALLKKEHDVFELIRTELSNRGLNEDGVFVGFHV